MPLLAYTFSLIYAACSTSAIDPQTSFDAYKLVESFAEEVEEEESNYDQDQEIKHRAALFIPLLGAGCAVSYLVVYLISGIVVAFRMKMKSVKILYPVIYSVYGAIRGIIMGILLGCCCTLVFRTSNILRSKGSEWIYVPLFLSLPVVAVNIFLNFFKKF